MKGAAGAAFYTVVGVGRDKIFLNLEEPPTDILVTLFVEMWGHTIISFVGWSMPLLDYDYVVIRWQPPHQLPPVGGIVSSHISVIAVPGAIWPWFCHVFHP